MHATANNVYNSMKSLEMGTTLRSDKGINADTNLDIYQRLRQENTKMLEII
jgi:hypothetical protein